MGLKSAISALLGISAYEQAPPTAGPTLDDAQVEALRKQFGGQLSPLPLTQTRWYQRDLETAIHNADLGDLSLAAVLYRSFKRDGTLSGLLSTRTSGLVRLPKRFRGDAEIKSALEARDGPTARSVFDDMFPSAELAQLAADGICLGIGVAELVPVPGRAFPVMMRHDPAFLRYRWNENRWYYTSIAGAIPIEPGLGRWILHVPGGRMAPWQNGNWQALADAWITKQHARMHRSNYSAKLANPARAATAPAGATEDQRKGFLASIIGWGVNTAFELPPGWDVKLIESKGEGFKVFQEEIATSDREIMIALAGQEVTTTGGTGFANADIHKSIRADLIQETADALAYTINTQGIPIYVIRSFGLDRLERGGATVEWDVTPPKDVKQEAESLKAFGEAIEKLTPALLPYKRTVDVGALLTKYGIPVAQDSDGDGNPDVNGHDEEPVEIDEIEVEVDDSDFQEEPTIQ